MSKLTTSNLSDLANQINAEHRRCQSAMKASLEYAVKVGELLIDAKSLVDHGAWLPWIADNCEFSERTARAYMRVSRNWPELSKTAATADLTLSGALKLLEEPKDIADNLSTIVDKKPTRLATTALWGEDKARAYDQIMAAQQEGYISLTPTSLEALPKLGDTGRVEVFWIGLMAGLLIIHGTDKNKDNSPDSVKWWIGDWLNYGDRVLPDAREYLKKACAAAYYLTTPEAKAILKEHNKI